MDDKGSCSFRHPQARGCVLMSVMHVVYVGGRVCKCALGVMGGECIGVCMSECVYRFSACVCVLS